MPQTRIVLADDHPLFLQGLVTLLKREQDMEMAGAFSDGTHVLACLEKAQVDICILDVNMPGLDGIETVKRIRQNNSTVKIIMLTTYNDVEFIRTLVRYNISGYVLKNSTGDDLVAAIRKVMQDGTWFSPEVQQSMAEDFVRQEKKKNEPGIVLTPREIDIVRLLAKELTNDEIAQKLFISFRTVETHRKNIMQKTGAKNLAGLISYAMHNGILP